MDAPLREVAAREESDRPQQRDRDRPTVVEDGVLSQPVDADRESSRRAAHRDQVVHARVVRRGLDPAATDRRSVRALDEREGRSRPMRERPGAGLAEDAEPVVARTVVDGDGDVHAPGAGVERDRHAHRAVDELGRACEPVAAQRGR